MKYIVYLTTNIKNQHIYVGVHQTENPEIFDGYLGNGLNRNKPSCLNHPKEPFHFAVKKYGFDSFKRNTIKIFDTLEEALYLEGQIVNEDFIKRDDTYNITLGGGLPPRNDIKVYQYDLEGKFIKEWKSYTEAGKFYSKCKDLSSVGTPIWRASIYNTKSFNFLWSIKKVDKLNLDLYKHEVQTTIVYLYDLNYKYLKSFKSISECCKELDICLEQARRSIRLQYKANGFYISDKLYEVLPKLNRTKLTGNIHQYDLNGNYLNTYSSIKEAQEKTGIELKNLNSYIKNLGFYKGFLWRRGDFVEKIEPYKVKSSRKVGQYTMNNELVKIFNTVREARKEFSNVSKVLAGTASHCHGYTFKYID